MKWITRERPKIDRIACPWLIARFIDDTPEFLFVQAPEVVSQATQTGAIPMIFRASNCLMWVNYVASMHS